MGCSGFQAETQKNQKEEKLRMKLNTPEEKISYDF